MRRWILTLTATALAAALTPQLRRADAAAPAPVLFDVVIRGGRVVDPETGLDAVRDIGIRAGRIAAMGQAPIVGRVTIDATGEIVGPGLIDLHSHGTNVASHWMQAFDGVTTSLGLEDGAWPVGRTYAAAAAEGRPLNYGYSVGWLDARRALFGARGDGLLEAGESGRVVDAVRQGLDEGGLGVGTPVGYAPASNRTEYLRIAELAASRGVPTFTHARFKNVVDPQSSVEGIGEVIAAAAATGAHMHICHINSLATRDLPLLLRMIRTARARGVPVSTEAYPYGSGSTIIGAPFLSPENLKLLALEPSAVTYLRTGERPRDAERLRQLRAADPQGFALITYLDEGKPADRALLESAILEPGVMIASDTIPFQRAGRDVPASWPLPIDAVGHPRSAATFMKVLQDQVLTERRMSVVEFFRRGALMPARLLEPVAPGMRHKGRVGVGADADLIVIDPSRLRVEATYARPAAPTVGVRHLLVNGVPVIRDGVLVTDARPGRAVRGAERKQAL